MVQAISPDGTSDLLPNEVPDSDVHISPSAPPDRPTVSEVLSSSAPNAGWGPPGGPQRRPPPIPVHREHHVARAVGNFGHLSSADRPPRAAAAGLAARAPSYTLNKKTSLLYWDVFLSYRVDADQELVKTLFWQLCHRTVVDGGKERKLRVFWDRECLKAGERWEEGFAAAISSSMLVVLVLSRNAFAMADKRHNVAALTAMSDCDNMVLEFNLALELNDLQGTAIMPLFVGDKTQDDKLTHFFQSECMPTLEESIVVDNISKKVEHYLEHHVGVSPDQMPERKSVKEIVKDVTQFQGHFLQGDPYEAVKGAAQGIYECAVRLVQERGAQGAVEIFKFSTPQGEEVYGWLADNRLLPFASIFAQNKLNSLRKVSRLTHEEVVEINQELYANRRGDQGNNTQKHGTRVALGDAIERLKQDERTKTVQVQMEDYRDSKVSVLNLLGAQNQISALLSKTPWVITLTVMCVCMVVWDTIRPQGGFATLSALGYTTMHRSVMTYGVQLSNDTNSWLYVPCPDKKGGPCVFDSSVTVTRPHALASGFFPQHHEARYVRILPLTWNGMEDGRGADMRLGILGEKSGFLKYSVLSEGDFGSAWLQYGCTLSSNLGVDLQTNASGRWSLLDEKVGEVQCCLNSPRIHVCTRDGCLSGDNDDVKFSWYEAKAKCEARGWRLCRRGELEMPGSAGCCTRTKTGTDRCGYNTELVWTADIGGTETGNIRGRINSEISFERSKEVIVDLEWIQTVWGIQMQGGAPDVPFNGPTCIISLVENMTYILFFAVTLIFSAWRPATRGHSALICVTFFILMGTITSVIVILNDPAAPGALSTNPTCPSSTRSNKSIFEFFWFQFGLFLLTGILALFQFLRPNWIILTLFSGGLIFVGILGTRGFTTWGASFGNFGMSPFFCALGVSATPIFMLLHRQAKRTAAKAISLDIQEYDRVWRAKISDSGEDLKKIKKLCADASSDIKRKRDEIASLWRSKDTIPLSFKATDFSLLERFCFWIGLSCLGRYGRTRKVCQITNNADMLFEEATVLNDDFFDFLESNIDIGEVCPGPVKRPDRAFQKVARKYYYDPRHLTDLVRCCILLESVSDVRRVLDHIFKLSLVFGEEASNSAEGNEPINEDEEALLGGGGDNDQKPTIFKLCKVKDDFTRDGLGYRYICLNLEVGWTIESESGDGLHFVTVKDFDKKHVRTHICEVQILLKSTYDLKVGGFHDNFVMARNILAQ